MKGFGDVKIYVSGGIQEDILNPFIKDGEIIRHLPRHKEIRKYVMEQVKMLPS